MLGGNPAPAPWSLTSVTQDKRMRAFDLHKEVWFGVWGGQGWKTPWKIKQNAFHS